MTRKEAQAIIAALATQDGEHQFAREVLAGAWDETNRADIAALMAHGPRECEAHNWVTDATGLIDTCTLCGEERA